MQAMVDGLSRLGDVSSPLNILKAAAGATGALKWIRATGKDLLDAHLSDPVLRGVLSGQAGITVCRLRRLRPSCRPGSPLTTSTADIIR